MRVFLVLLLASAALSAQTKLLRFPDVHGDQVVFTYAGDLWKASTQGGDAVRLTAHPGLEVFGKFSPDGSQIAFTGQYDGDEQVYVIPADGGEPKQLTWYPSNGPLPDRWGFDHLVYGWAPNGQSVLFRSGREFWGPGANARLYTVSTRGGLPQPLPMPVSGAGDIAPDNNRIAYSPLFRDFRTWKRYQGGWAQDLYIYYRDTGETQRVTDDARTDRDPMWVNGAVYFASDRDGTLNLYRFDPKSKKTRQVTKQTNWDVRWPSSDGEARIVFALDGELHLLDAKSGKSRRVPIRVPDDGVHARPKRISAAKNVEDFELSPDGKRALFVARGDVFTVPAEKGPTRNLTNTSNAHERLARWSPDGRWIAYVSDQSGEEQIWRVAQDGSGDPEQLTSGREGKLYRPAWSPDSKHIAFSDKEGRIFVLDLETKAATEIANEERGQVSNYVWSPKGGHLAFSLTVSERTSSLYIWSAADGVTRRVTGELFSEYNPAWDPKGEYLYFLSDRTYAPQISTVEWNFAANRQTGIFALALRKDVKHPFPPQSDETAVQKESAEPKEEKKDDDAKSNDQPIRIDFDGLAARVAPVPVEADNYGALSAIEGHLVYVRSPAFYYGRASAAKTALQIYNLKERKAESLTDDVAGYALSLDGKKVLVRQGQAYKLYDAKPKAKDPKTITTAGLQVQSTPREEWRTIFGEVWRRYRDFFYVENMHGYDWNALRAQYEPWLDHVAHRLDLNYVLGEMVSELVVGHAYIAGGDFDRPERPKVALLGADLEADPTSNRYRFTQILAGHNQEARYRSPLTEIGVDVSVGDYLIAIDGEDLAASVNPYRLLRHKADRPVELTVNSTPSAEGARTVQIRPVSSEANLRYLNWVESNRRKVDEATNGEVGYFHVPDMAANGIREFIKYFYPQMRKKGLIVDVRGNGGGNVSQMLLVRLQRELLGTRFSRTNDHVSTYPETVFHGKLVCLINENSASDGDIFPARFQKAELGPLIGKRSWGGVIGIRGHGPLLDGGDVRVPEFATNDVDGSYIIENFGVAPDIEVENDPASVLAGRDPQLERGVEEVVRLLRESPMPLPARPDDPVKTK